MPFRSPFYRMFLAADLQGCASGVRPPWPWLLLCFGGSSSSSCPPSPSAAEVPLPSLLPSLLPFPPRCLVLQLLSCAVPIYLMHRPTPSVSPALSTRIKVAAGLAPQSIPRFGLFTSHSPQGGPFALRCKTILSWGLVIDSLLIVDC